MAFRFPLEAVFHFRQSMEHQQEVRLHAANQQVARVRKLIQDLDERMQLAHESASQALAAGLTSAELRFSHTAQICLLARRKELEREVVRLQHLRDQQQLLFQSARRERETIEILRDQQVQEYQRAQARREQRDLDELFLTRLSYREHG